MNVENFLEVLNCDFYAGVPDSQLKELCNYLIYKYGIDLKHHVISANEGNAVGLAAGYHLSTGKTPVVYMQNSGEGNVVNPICSLMNDKVYGIPLILVIGWRGEPNVHDEPQHIFQGEITCSLLDVLDIKYMVISNDTTIDEVKAKMEEFNKLLSNGKQVAFVVKKNALKTDVKVKYENDNDMLREDIIIHIVNVSKEDTIVSTTGKASRELFEIREGLNMDHSHDFLTVGSMGHSSSIALEIAAQKPDKKIWIIDGDGAVLMHMGSMALIGSNKPKNIVHIIINNAAHETVGGQPTVMKDVDLVKISSGLGYMNAVSVNNFNDLDIELNKAKERNELALIEVKSSIGARENLGRPTTTAKENKIAFMNGLK